MHELSVTEGILKICLDEGKKHNIENKYSSRRAYRSYAKLYIILF